MIFSKTLVRHIFTGMASLGVIGGWGTAAGTLAIATATPAAACNSEPYVGTTCTFAFDWCPRGYLPADGRIVSVQEYQTLFALIGSAYGGNNSTDFALPDLRGRTVVASGTGLGFQPVNFAAKVGQQSILLNSSQVPLVAHTHQATFVGTGNGVRSVNVAPSPGSLNVTSKLQAVQAQGTAQPQNGSLLGMGGSGSQQAPIYVASSSTATQVELGGLDVKLTGSPGNGPITFDVPTGITGGTVTVAPTGQSATQLVSTQSPGIGMKVCIAVIGLFPPRP